MQADQILTISQIIAKLSEYSDIFEKAFNNSDKERFDSSAKAILELQKKLEFILK